MKYLVVFFLACVGVLEGGKVSFDRRGIHHYCSDVSRRLGWQLSGEGYFHDEPAVSPSIQFSAPQCLSVDEARCIIVSECDRLVQMAGRTQPKKVTMVTGPFTVRNIAYSVYFENPETGLEYELPYVAGVFVSRGKIIYNSRNNTTRRYGCIQTEPYEEAVRIVQAEQAVAVECR